MGKSEKKKRHTGRATSSVLPTAAPATESAPTESTSTASVPALQHLLSLNPTDRAWASASLSNLALDPSVRPTLLSHNVIGSLIMLLSDAPEVAVEAAGALRNFILSDPEEEGKETVADEVYRKDGMTPLLALVPKFVTFFTEKPYLKKDSMNADGADADGDEGMGKKMSRKERKALKAANAGEQQPEQSNGQSSEQPAAEKKKEKKDDVKAVIELAEQVLGVLSVLCERTPKSHALASGPLPPLLLTILPQAGSLPPAISLASAQLLAVLSEENEAVHKQFAENPEWLASLVGLLERSQDPAKFSHFSTNELAQLGLLLGATIQNLAGIPGDPSLAQKAGSLILATISKVLGHDLDASFAAAVAEAVEGTEELPDGFAKPVQQQGKGWENVVLALEVLSNLASGPMDDPVPEKGKGKEGADGEWEDMEMDGDGEEMEDGEAAEPEGEEEEDDDDEFPGDDEMAEVLGEEGTEARISTDPMSMQLSEPALLTALQRLATGPANLGAADIGKAEIVNGAMRIQARALGALANILMSLDKPFFSTHAADLAGVWERTFGILAGAQQVEAKFGDAAKEDVADVLEGGITLLLSIAKGLAPPALSPEFNLPLTIPDQALDGLLQLPIRGTIPLLTLLAQRRPGYIPQNLAIGRHFVGLALNTANLSDLADALDGLFDVYADGAWDYDVNWKGQGWLEALRKGYAGIKAKVKGVDKRKERELRERADLAVMNLKAFLDYKAREARG